MAKTSKKASAVSVRNNRATRMPITASKAPVGAGARDEQASIASSILPGGAALDALLQTVDTKKKRANQQGPSKRMKTSSPEVSGRSTRTTRPYSAKRNDARHGEAANDGSSEVSATSSVRPGGTALNQLLNLAAANDKQASTLGTRSKKRKTNAISDANNKEE